MRACGKIILLGEHAVVYGKPGIAVPVNEVYTEVNIFKSDSFEISSSVNSNEEGKIKLDRLIELVFSSLKLEKKELNITITSTIPISSGLGSSASLSIALIKSLADYFKLNISVEKINLVAYECEKIFHGNPSGIDNTVIAFSKPVFFTKEKYEFFNIKTPLRLMIANTGIRPDTKAVVSEVKSGYEKNKILFARLFDEIENVVMEARYCIESGNISTLGKLMTENHELLKKIGVSNSQLDLLVRKSLDAGAFGAKLAGAGKGGNMIALVDSRTEKKVRDAIKKDAKAIISTIVNS